MEGCACQAQAWIVPHTTQLMVFIYSACFLRHVFTLATKQHTQQCSSTAGDSDQHPLKESEPSVATCSKAETVPAFMTLLF